MQKTTLRSHKPVQVRIKDSNLLAECRKVTRLTKTEIISQALTMFTENLPISLQEEITNNLRRDRK